MVKLQCCVCKSILDSNAFSETSKRIYTCYDCFTSKRRNNVIQESKRRNDVIQEIERELESIKNDSIDCFTSKRRNNVIQESKRRNDVIQEIERELDILKNDNFSTIIEKKGISIEYMEKINDKINELKNQLANFMIETRDTLNTILCKYSLDNNPSKAFLLNYESKTISLNEALELYYSLDYSEFREIMLETYNLTHKNPIKSWNKKVEIWSNKYPDIVNRKINGIKSKLKEANKDVKKSKKMKELYYSEKMIEFRYPTIRKMLNARGHLNVSDFSIMDSLKTNYKWENMDIMNDLIANKNNNPDNDIDIELMFEEEEPSEFELHGSYSNPSSMNTKDILNIR